MNKTEALPTFARVSSPSFYPGDELNLHFELQAQIELCELISNLSINLFRIEKRRNQLQFGFGAKPNLVGRVLEITQKLPNDIPVGLYMVGGITGTLNINGTTVSRILRIPPTFFSIQPVIEKRLSEVDLKERLTEAEIERREYVGAIHRTNSLGASSEGKKYKVLILGVGCLIHTAQQLKGFEISPIGEGLSHGPVHKLLNSLVQRDGYNALPFSDEIEQQYIASAPVFFVKYPNVIALDLSDALSYCQEHARFLFEILGLNRGQMPKEIAAVAIEEATGECVRNYQVPGYRGNLVSDFNPAATANVIDDLMPKLQSNPFLRLLCAIYAEATAEPDAGFGLLRYWTVLELLADRKIEKGCCIRDPDNVVILCEDGRPETTNSSLTRVYELIVRRGAYRMHMSYSVDGESRKALLGASADDPAKDDDTELISLWDVVKAAYAVRCMVAHEGRFDIDAASVGDPMQKLAAVLSSHGGFSLYGFVRDQAQGAFWKEAHLQ